MLKAEATQLKAKWGTGEKRQQKQEALVGVSDTVEAKRRSPEALAELLVDPEAARARRPREGATDDAPRAQQVRRVASLVRTKPAVMELIKADAARRDPEHHTPVVVRLDGALGRWHLTPQLFKPWKRRTCLLDILHVVGSLWSAANAWFGEGSKDGTRWVQAKLTAILRGRVGYVIGGLRQILTKPRRRTSVREALETSDHVLPPPPALDAVRGIPGGRLAHWDRRRGVGVRCRRQAPDGGRRQALEPGRG